MTGNGFKRKQAVKWLNGQRKVRRTDIKGGSADFRGSPPREYTLRSMSNDRNNRANESDETRINEGEAIQTKSSNTDRTCARCNRPGFVPGELGIHFDNVEQDPAQSMERNKSGDRNPEYSVL